MKVTQRCRWLKEVDAREKRNVCRLAKKDVTGTPQHILKWGDSYGAMGATIVPMITWNETEFVHKHVIFSLQRTSKQPFDAMTSPSPPKKMLCVKIVHCRSSL